MNTPKKCFLIEDDLDDQEIFGMALRNTPSPMECVFADDGIHALEILTSDTSFVPDYIFIDFNMPRMNGIQCLQAIKKMSHLDNSRIVMYSTSSEAKLINESKANGADDFIVKPSSITLLSKRLDGLFLS